MAGFTFTATSGDGCFHIGRKPSILSDGLVFRLTESITGFWTNSEGNVVNKGNSNSIRFKTSISSEEDDSLNINLFIGRRRVVYDENGRARILYAFDQHQELVKFLEDKIGRDADNPENLKGTAKEVAEKVLKDFFGEKDLIVREEKNLFIKTIKDGVEKLEVPFDPIYTIRFKE